jgi:putative transposase
MLVNQSFKYELKPNNKQIGLLFKCCGVARFAYNWGLAQRKEIYKIKKGKERLTNATKQFRELNALKKTMFPWMYEVSKYVPQSALKDLDQAYSNLYRRVRNHERKIGKPKFKKKGLHDSFRIVNNSTNQKQVIKDIRIENDSIRISKIGFIRTKESVSKLKGRILNVTISREADKWFCSLCVELDRPSPQQVRGEIIGIDLGINCFATISSGNKIVTIYSPKPLRKRIKKLKHLHRRLNNKHEGSSNRKKAQLRLAILYKRIKNIRKDFISKETSELAKTKSVIVIEDLNVSGMLKNHRLARSIGDEGWGEFRRMLEYKTQWYGSKLIKIPRFEPSSKRCNHCGEINHDLKLSDRIWVCLNCGIVNERDPNAAHNIRDKGIELLDTDSLSELQACGVDVRPSQRMAVDNEAGIKRILYK